ncbi:aldehyde:ferredoxin oxidoreductase [Aciduliprofundum sp. MAR08-339]|uniref:aldehyde ferredoxin oxidoreductase family protein n=1 Tax=Aciduliprofundum sp. (strain MAR08-339) TaxID=673860 RepID=UPI0002A4C2C8|nr:aldehyde:ferredoxin oxidoreductase [Aciduliprofundum sp. MAR08-339]
MITGKILRINLDTQSVGEEVLPEEVLKKYPGGKALGYYIFAREVPPNIEPFYRENKILFVPGLLSGLAPGASKVAVISKSPETNLIHDSYAGDRFGPFLHRWGYAAMIIEGRAKSPVYITVGDNVDILPADFLWGKGVYEVSDEIWKRHGDGAIAAIGPAGENLVRFANIMFDTERSAGRGGLGAVMGSKNLKAIFIKPMGVENMKIEISKRDEWDKTRSELYQKLDESASPSLKIYGTTNSLVLSGKRGMSPAYNFSKPYIPEELARKLGGDEAKKYEIEPERFVHGKSCPVKCARYIELEYNGKKFRVKPEYESIGMLGAATGVFNFPDVAYLIHLANDLGLDAIAAGNTIGWLFELVERGLVGSDEIGVPVKGFGDAQAEENLLRMIAYRRGFGAILAEGVKRAGEILNRGQRHAVHVKGLESPAWDPRGLRTYGLSYATADVGASHLRGWPYPRSLPNDGPAKELVANLIQSRDKDALFDTLGLCKFVPWEKEDIESILSTLQFSGDLKNVGWRTECISRVYAIASGLIPEKDDTIPPRWWEKEEDGPARGNAAFMNHEDFIEARREFYRLRGWDENGVPKKETLKILGIEEFSSFLR